MRGIIGNKIGMTQLFMENGECLAATAIEAGPCVVTHIKTQVKDGYDAVQLGFGTSKRLTKAEKGHLHGLGEFPYLHEFRTTDAASVGDSIDVGMLAPGDVIKVTGT
ncbi:MAG: 50S ribosomal protein L3, partial [Dehalococcoidia bacterium]|nr:50S ribosomal protein L3 [Dehalococcoidia bacterium]